MSVTVDTVQLFNPPVAHNTICFMTSAVSAAFAASHLFLKQLSPNSGRYYRLNKLSSHNSPPPTAQDRAQAEPHHAGTWGQQLPVAPSCSSAPSQQHQAMRIQDVGADPPQILQQCLTFKMLFKEYEKEMHSPTPYITDL